MDSNVVSMPREELATSMDEIALDDMGPLYIVPEGISTKDTKLLGLFLQAKLCPNVIFCNVSPQSIYELAASTIFLMFCHLSSTFSRHLPAFSSFVRMFLGCLSTPSFK